MDRTKIAIEAVIQNGELSLEIEQHVGELSLPELTQFLQLCIQFIHKQIP